MTTSKSFARRDSATALLRKMGIDKADYNKFITAKGDSFVVDVAAAEKSAIKGAEQAAVSAGEAKSKKATTKPAKKAEPKATEKAPAKKAAKQFANPVDQAPTPGQTTTNYVRTLISAGHTNAEIFDALKRFKDFDDSKSYYPAWNRWAMRKEGFEV